MSNSLISARDIDSSLPEKYLCLTIDDGPSPISHLLAQKLFELDVPTTFFVNYDPVHWSGLEAYWQWGHLVANHTRHHDSLTRQRRNELPEYVEEFQSLLDPYIDCCGGGRYIRAPYGEWNSIVAERLRTSHTVTDLIGHIGWDYDTRDWAHWRNLPAASLSSRILQRRVHQEINSFHKSLAQEIGLGLYGLVRWLRKRQQVSHRTTWSEFVQPELPDKAAQGEIDIVLDNLEDAFHAKNFQGGIVLMHENNRDNKIPVNTFAAITIPFVTRLVARCRKLGFRFVGLDCCQGVRNLQASLGHNARPQNWFHCQRGAGVHWQKVCLHNACFLERSAKGDILWRTGKDHRLSLRRKAIEIGGRRDDSGHIRLFLLDHQHTIWHQAICKGDSPEPQKWSAVTKDAIALCEIVERQSDLILRYKCQNGSYREICDWPV